MSSRWLISLLGFKSLDPFDPLKYSPFPERLDSSIYPLSRSIRSRYMLVFRGIAIRSRKTLEWLNLIRLSSSITRFGDLARVLLFRVSNLRHLLWPFLIKKYHLNYRFRFESRVVLRLKSSKFSRLTKSENRIGDDKLVYVIRFWTIPIWFSTRCFVCKIIMSFLSMSMKVCHLLEVLEVWYDRNSKVYCALIRDFLWARLQDISSQTLFLVSTTFLLITGPKYLSFWNSEYLMFIREIIRLLVFGIKDTIIMCCNDFRLPTLMAFYLIRILVFTLVIFLVMNSVRYILIWNMKIEIDIVFELMLMSCFDFYCEWHLDDTTLSIWISIITLISSFVILSKMQIANHIPQFFKLILPVSLISPLIVLGSFTIYIDKHILKLYHHPSHLPSIFFHSLFYFPSQEMSQSQWFLRAAGKNVEVPKVGLKITIPQFDNLSLISGYSKTLIGRCMNPFKQDVKALLFMLPKIWQMEDRVTGADLGPGRFQFDFDNEEDILHVLQQEPFHFDFGCWL